MNDAERPLIGRTLGGRFVLASYLGEGAMASVYRGSQDDEPRDVAIKVMHPQLAADPTVIKRFQREAKAAARLNHPNTVQVIGYGVEGNLVFIAMEFLAGQDLFDVLARERRFAEARAVRIVTQICDALHAAHTQGIVHRDLKPENVMLLRHPEDPSLDLVKVLDFGIAKVLQRDAQELSDEPPNSMPNSALTTVGTVVGTPEYMSPEQCRGGEIDARSDVYACGVLLYRLVAGRTPFIGNTPIDIAMKHVTDEPDPPSKFAPGLHAGLEKSILTALGKWPAQRQESALALRDELLAVLPELSTTPRHSGRVGNAARAQAVAAADAAAEKQASAAAPESGRKTPALPGVPAQVVISGAAKGETPKAGAVAKSEAVAAEPVPKSEPVVTVEPVTMGETPIPPAQPVAEAPAKAEPAAARTPLPVPSLRKEPATPRPLAEAGHGSFVDRVPNWAVVAGLVLICVAIWLVRFLRFS